MAEDSLILQQKLGFDKVRSMVCARCQSEFALALAGAETFSTDEYEIRRRLQLTDEMRLVLMFEDAFPTGGFIDTLDFLLPLRQPSSTMDVVSLRKLRTMLDTLSKVVSFFEASPSGVYPNLKKMTAPVASFPIVVHRIDSIIDRYGNIRDNASEELLRIRRETAAKEDCITKRVASVLRRAQEEGIVDSDTAPSMRDGRILIPVPAASKRRIAGYIYDESSSGKTAFVEPAEIVELTNEIKELQFAEQREIVRILFEFCEFLRPYLEDLLSASRYLGTIDFIMAKAQVALDMVAGMPIFSTDGAVNLRKARHPLLEKALKAEGRSIVPINITLTPQKRILLVSGPNAGGKSVCMKTMGLLQYMFQWGLLIPTSETSEMVVFDRIMVDIGDDQNLESDLSTYSSFLVNMKEMLSKADGRSLVLADEFGSGTEPAVGGAIAEALLCALEKAGVYGVITTHYTNLKMYASRPDSAVINGAMAFDSQKIAPLFKLETGLPGNSFAFALARKMGLPEEIIKDAEARAGDDLVDMERSLRKIERSRRALDEKLERVSRADKTLENITDKYQKELSDIKELRRKIIEEAQAQAREIVAGANREVEKTIRTIKESQAQKEPTTQARADLQNFLGALASSKSQSDEYVERKLRQLEARKERNEQRKNRRAGGERNAAQAREQEQQKALQEAFRNGPVQVGEKVRVKDGGIVGEVVKVSGKNLLLTVGNLTTKVPASKVERITSNEFKAAVREIEHPSRSTIIVDAAVQERKLSFRPELDLRGARLSEALNTVMHYVDDALMLGVPQVRIVHGKGTGVLHEEIQKYLRTVPGVQSVADEHIQFGGSGVTIVTFY